MEAAESPRQKSPRRLAWMLLGAVLAGLLFGLYGVVRLLARGYDYPHPHARGLPVAAVEDPINAAWLIAGSPRFRTTQYFRSFDGRTSAGLWEATGPARFEWHYGSDEVVLVLEGGARLTQHGQTSAIGPGDRVTFRAGETVLWEVPERIKKTWVLDDPGWLARHLRRLGPRG